jgi:hypothetical protein
MKIDGIDGIERIEGIEGIEGFEEFSKPEALRIHNPSTERGELELSAAKPKTRNPKLFKPFKPETLQTRNSSNPKPFNRVQRAQRS